MPGDWIKFRTDLAAVALPGVVFRWWCAMCAAFRGDPAALNNLADTRSEAEIAVEQFAFLLLALGLVEHEELQVFI